MDANLLEAMPETSDAMEYDSHDNPNHNIYDDMYNTVDYDDDDEYDNDYDYDYNSTAYDDIYISNIDELSKNDFKVYDFIHISNCDVSSLEIPPYANQSIISFENCTNLDKVTFQGSTHEGSVYEYQFINCDVSNVDLSKYEEAVTLKSCEGIDQAIFNRNCDIEIKSMGFPPNFDISQIGDRITIDKDCANLNNIKCDNNIEVLSISNIDVSNLDTSEIKCELLFIENCQNVDTIKLGDNIEYLSINHSNVQNLDLKDFKGDVTLNNCQNIDTVKFNDNIKNLDINRSNIQDLDLKDFKGNLELWSCKNIDTVKFGSEIESMKITSCDVTNIDLQGFKGELSYDNCEGDTSKIDTYISSKEVVIDRSYFRTDVPDYRPFVLSSVETNDGYELRVNVGDSFLIPNDNPIYTETFSTKEEMDARFSGLYDDLKANNIDLDLKAKDLIEVGNGERIFVSSTLETSGYFETMIFSIDENGNRSEELYTEHYATKEEMHERHSEICEKIENGEFHIEKDDYFDDIDQMKLVFDGEDNIDVDINGNATDVAPYDTEDAVEDSEIDISDTDNISDDTDNISDTDDRIEDNPNDIDDSKDNSSVSYKDMDEDEAKKTIACWYVGVETDVDRVVEAIEYIEDLNISDPKIENMIDEIKGDLMEKMGVDISEKDIDTASFDDTDFENGEAEYILENWFAGIEDDTTLVEKAVEYLDKRPNLEPNIRDIVNEAKEILQELSGDIELNVDIAEGIVVGWYGGLESNTDLVEKALDYLENNLPNEPALKEMIAEARNDIGNFRDSIDKGVDSYMDGAAEGIVAGWYAGIEMDTELVEEALNYLDSKDTNDSEFKDMIEKAKEDLQEYKDKIDTDNDNLEDDNDTIESDYDDDDDDYDPVD